MFLLLIQLFDYFGYQLPHFLQNYSTRMIFACLTSLAIWLSLGPYFIKKLYELKIGQKIRMEECPLLGQLHEKKKETPTMGGALILFAMTLSSLLWMDCSHLYTWLLLLSSLSMGVVGGYDDYLKLKWKNPIGLSARKKMMAQACLGVVITAILLMPMSAKLVPLHYPKSYDLSQPSKAASTEQIIEKEALSTSQTYHLFYIPCIKKPITVPQGLIVGGLLSLFFCFVIAGSSNAVNLTDGLDGLAAGAVMQSALCLTVVAFISNHIHFSNYLNWLYIEGSAEVAIFLMSLIGACLGFLWFNCYPAQVFMGDTGSLGLGAALGTAAILLRRELFFALASGLFIVETLSVMIQVWSFRRRGKRVFLCAPLHHHFEYKGWPETKVVMRFWIIALLFGLTALMTIKLQ